MPDFFVKTIEHGRALTVFSFHLLGRIKRVNAFTKKESYLTLDGREGEECEGEYRHHEPLEHSVYIVPFAKLGVAPHDVDR